MCLDDLYSWLKLVFTNRLPQDSKARERTWSRPKIPARMSDLQAGRDSKASRNGL